MRREQLRVGDAYYASPTRSWASARRDYGSIERACLSSPRHPCSQQVSVSIRLPCVFHASIACIVHIRIAGTAVRRTHAVCALHQPPPLLSAKRTARSPSYAGSRKSPTDTLDEEMRAFVNALGRYPKLMRHKQLRVGDAYYASPTRSCSRRIWPATRRRRVIRVSDA